MTGMKRDLFELASRLTQSGVSFVVATVVRRDGKSSAHQGDMALVTAVGEFHGWIGGGGIRPTIEREAKLAIEERRPRLICLAPAPERELRPGVVVLPMTCQSGGTVEIYLDPVIAAPRLILLGRSPIITALAALGHAAGYRVDVADPEARADEVPAAHRVLTSFEAAELRERDGAPTAVVVATMGEHDEEATLAALTLSPSYLGVVASRPRSVLLRQALTARGVSVAALDTITSPAGLALRGQGDGEIAISILAQIVGHLHGVVGTELATAPRPALRRLPMMPPPNSELPASPPGIPAAPLPGIPTITPPAGTCAGAASAANAMLSGDAVDPVCLRAVPIAKAVHIGTWDDRAWYFCCAACKLKFLANPGRYLAVDTGGKIGAVQGTVQ